MSMTTVATRSRTRPVPNVYAEGHAPAVPSAERPETPAPMPRPETARPKKLKSRSKREAMHLPEAVYVGQKPPTASGSAPVDAAAGQGSGKKATRKPKTKTKPKTVTAPKAKVAKPVSQAKGAAKKPTRIDRKTLAKQVQEAVDTALLYSLLHSEDLQKTRQRAADAITEHFHLPHNELPPVDDLQKIESRLEKLQNQIEMFADVIERAQSAMAVPAPQVDQPQVDQPQVVPAVGAVGEAPSNQAEPPATYDDLLRRLLEENIKLSRNEES